MSFIRALHYVAYRHRRWKPMLVALRIRAAAMKILPGCARFILAIRRVVSHGKRMQEAVTSHRFDWDSLPGLAVEARLSQLCRWIEDAYAEGRAFGLKLPNVELPANIGPAHRQRCLTALAVFGHEGALA